MRSNQKKPTRRASSSRRGRATSQPPEAPVVEPIPEPQPAAVVEDAARDETLSTSGPETVFATRVAPPPAPRPVPDSRRAIFFDVENTSRPEHVARVIDHLAVDRLGRQTELIAVGNWRVASAETARLLARHGAHLVHSAPSTGVRDWSDLRIAVSAGVWLAGARAGDIIEIISDDRAFDAVGDVAASLGVAYRRLSFRSLAGIAQADVAAREPEPDGRAGRRRGRRRGRRDHGGRPAHHQAPAPAAPAAAPASEPGGAHTAPHDEIVGVARDLIERSERGAVTLDALANALKSRGFRRTPGSPRLITRLRRIKELHVSRAGVITLSSSAPPAEAEPVAAGIEAEPARAAADVAAPEPEEEETAEAPAGAAEEPAADAAVPRRGRRRGRRGGRRRRRHAVGAAPQAAGE